MSGYYNQGSSGGFGGYAYRPPAGGGGSGGYPTAASSGAFTRSQLGAEAAEKIKNLLASVTNDQGSYRKKVATMSNYTDSLRQQQYFSDADFKSWRESYQTAGPAVDNIIQGHLMRRIPEIDPADASTWSRVQKITKTLNEDKEEVQACGNEYDGFYDRTPTARSNAKRRR